MTDRSVVSLVRESAAGFLRDALPTASLREIAAGDAFPEGLWAGGRRLGWPELLAGVESDEPGTAMAVAAAVFEEAGKALFPGPLLETVVLLPLLRRSGLDADGPITLARLGSKGEVAWESARLEGERVSGAKTLVPFADQATVACVFAVREGTPVLVVVDTRGPGVDAHLAAGYDGIGRACDLFLDDASGRVIAEGASAVLAAAGLEESAFVLSATYLLGIMRTCLQLSVSHAAGRVQFGRPIGSFQAVQQRLADMAARVEAAAACCARAAEARATDHGEVAARVAKGFTSLAAREVFESALQVHGGIGFTDEYVLHHYVKRGLALAAQWGSASDHGRWIGESTLRG